MPRHPVRDTAPVADRLSAAFDRFLHVEAISGAVLLAAACIALVWANSPWADTYDAFWHMPFAIGVGPWIVSRPLHFWINDGLMAVFFLVVGLEIRRELHEGALASLRVAVLPAIAAAGGVAVPALIYLAFNHDSPARQGWAVPTATDIAFAVGVLALLGRRVPAAVRVLLLAIAVIDDIVAILVIALFYSSGIEYAGLAIAALGIALALAGQRLGIRSAPPYLVPGIVVWAGLLYAGLHPTLAGVMLGLITPVGLLRGRHDPLTSAGQSLERFRDRRDHRDRDAHALVQPLRDLQRAQLQMLPPVIRVQAILHPWVAYGVMPLFALANAGVRIDATGGDSLTLAAGAGILLGLAIGKPLGIILSSAIAVKLRWCALPAGVDWRGMITIGCLGGVGFTMAIFIATLAFAEPAMLGTAKLAVLLGSATASLTGLVIGWTAFRRRPGHSAAP